jgi:hypothetical protein
MDEISQDPELSFRFLRGQWLDVAVAVAQIAGAAVMMTGRGSRPAAAPAPRPGAGAGPALLPSAVRTWVRLPFGQPGDMTILGRTAWISDWSASKIVGVDLAAGRVTRTVHVGGQLNEPVSMTSGAGSVWVLDSFGSLLRIDPASGVITKRFLVRGLGADVAYGDGYICCIPLGHRSPSTGRARATRYRCIYTTHLTESATSRRSQRAAPLDAMAFTAMPASATSRSSECGDADG